MKSLVLLALFLGTAVAYPGPQLKSGTKTGILINHIKDNIADVGTPKFILIVNEWADLVLEEVRNAIMNLGFDPMQLPDVHESFKYKPFFVTYRGELDLTSGWMSDSSTLYRGGNVSIEYKENILTIQIPLNFKDFLFDYQYNVKLMGFGPSGSVDGKVNNVEVFCAIEIDLNTNIVSLKNFEFAKIGKIDVNFHGNWLIDLLFDTLSDIVTFVFKRLIKDIAGNIVSNILESIIAIINVILGILT